jgi:pyocin large subunit-like protein
MGTGRGGQYSHTKGAEGWASRGGRIKATQFLPGELKRHYDDHEHEFNVNLEPDEYETRARNFFDKPITKDIQWFEDVDGVLYKYDKKNREFGMCLPEGAIITYFRPVTGMKYWEDQVEKHDYKKMRLLWR